MSNGTNSKRSPLQPIGCALFGNPKRFIHPEGYCLSTSKFGGGGGDGFIVPFPAAMARPWAKCVGFVPFENSRVDVEVDDQDDYLGKPPQKDHFPTTWESYLSLGGPCALKGLPSSHREIGALRMSWGS